VFVPTNDWSEQVARTVAREVRRLRRAQKLSAQQLAFRCTELGMPSISRAVLADLENGRRLWVGVTEVMVLARALNTTPVGLIYPDPCAANVEMLPGVPASGPFALQWFTGHLDGGPARAAAADDLTAYDRNLRGVQLARQIWELQERQAALMKAELRADAKERSAWVDAIADLERRVGAVMQEYGALTGQPGEAPDTSRWPGDGQDRPAAGSRALRFQSEGDSDGG
jgi:transcriptional regulator with XRE-family HTH domain